MTLIAVILFQYTMLYDSSNVIVSVRLSSDDKNLYDFMLTEEFWQSMALEISNVRTYVEHGRLIAKFHSFYPDFIDIDEWILRKLSNWNSSTNMICLVDDELDVNIIIDHI